jgi:agmatinase
VWRVEHGAGAGDPRRLRGINLVGMDLVEVAPAYDHADITALAGATLAMEMLCLYAARHKVSN